MTRVMQPGRLSTLTDVILYIQFAEPNLISECVFCLGQVCRTSGIIEFCVVWTPQTAVRVLICFIVCFISCFILIVLYLLSLIPWVISRMYVTCVLLPPPPPHPALVYINQAVWLLAAVLSGFLSHRWATVPYLSCFLCFDLPSRFPGCLVSDFGLNKHTSSCFKACAAASLSPPACSCESGVEHKVAPFLKRVSLLPHLQESFYCANIESLKVISK